MDAAAEQLVATIVFPGSLQTVFHYRVPDGLRAQMEPGRRVRVPFGRGNRMQVGYCVELETRSDVPRRLKAVEEVIDGRTLLSSTMLRLTRWMAEHYLCTWAAALEAVLPAGVRSQAGMRRVTRVKLAADAKEKMAGGKLSKKQFEIVQFLAANPQPIEPSQLARAVHCTVAPITALRRRGVLSASTQRISAEAHQASAVARQLPFELNLDQQAALAAITDPLRAPRHETILIHGVTGSGKTEVYIQAIQEAVSYGRQAIMLVPEISLTPQTEERFRAVRSGGRATQSFERCPAPLALGTNRSRRSGGRGRRRSAVFAPAPHLGLIVVDEEHEGSFKQDSAPQVSCA